MNELIDKKLSDENNSESVNNEALVETEAPVENEN